MTTFTCFTAWTLGGSQHVRCRTRKTSLLFVCVWERETERASEWVCVNICFPSMNSLLPHIASSSKGVWVSTCVSRIWRATSKQWMKIVRRSVCVCVCDLPQENTHPYSQSCSGQWKGGGLLNHRTRLCLSGTWGCLIPGVAGSGWVVSQRLTAKSWISPRNLSGKYILRGTLESQNSHVGNLQCRVRAAFITPDQK